MSTSRRVTEANDHLNRDGYIYLSILTARLSADIERLCAQHDLTEAHYRVLWVLCLSDSSRPLHMGDIVDGVVNKASDVTRLVDKLERLGHVSRRSSPDDRRRVLVSVTPLGKRVFANLTKDIKTIHYHQWAGLDTDELQSLVKLLRKALRGLDQ